MPNSRSFKISINHLSSFSLYHNRLADNHIRADTPFRRLSAHLSVSNSLTLNTLRQKLTDDRQNAALQDTRHGILLCNSWHIAMQKVAFHTAKGHLLQRKAI